MGGGCHFFTISRNGERHQGGQGGLPLRRSRSTEYRVYADLSLLELEGEILSGYLGPVRGGATCPLLLGQGCYPAPGWALSGCGPAGPVRSWCRPLSRRVRRQHSSQTPDLDCFASAVNAVFPKFFSKILQQGSSGVDFFDQQPQEHNLFLCPPVSCASQGPTVHKDLYPDPDPDNLSAENPIHKFYIELLHF
jgi:hypothetical protein